MTARELKKKYLAFFIKKGHKKLPNLPLVPEDDPTTLFISAGMHPLVPYLLGEVHPLGKRLVSNQRCLRTGDIEFVGDPHHLTFFEMLGNWSLGVYWKEKAISWSWEFLIKELGLSPEKLHVSCFKGDKDAPKDEESAKIWQKLGVPKEKIHFFGKKVNWWGPVGETGPCGPDTEMFIDVGGDCRLGKSGCDPSCQCGKYFEVWNDVFMEYNKTAEGKYESLKQKNVDTGMGVERTIAVLQGKDDIFLIEGLVSVIKEIEKGSDKKYQGKNKEPMRVIADHLRAATFVINDGVEPSNKDRGYVLRRLIRRAAVKMRQLGGGTTPISSFQGVCKEVIRIYGEEYFKTDKARKLVDKVIDQEMDKFGAALERGLKEFEKAEENQLGALFAFNLFQTYGFPLEITEELFKQKGKTVDREEFRNIYEKHQELSRKTAAKMFKGGLADHSEEVTKLHTTTHLLHQALRDVLGKQVQQVGSNITPQRLRFDFTHPKKLTEAEIKKVEEILNQKIKDDLPVKMEMTTLAEARKKGALAFFGERYGEKVKIYSIGNYSKEVCGGPHVKSTGEIGGVRIVKEKAVGTGRRRIYAQLIKSEARNPKS